MYLKFTERTFSTKVREALSGKRSSTISKSKIDF